MRDGEEAMKKKTILFIFILSMLCLTGCPGKAYSRDESNAQKEKGKEMMEVYMEENIPGAKLEEIYADTTSIDSCRYLTDFVRGTFNYEDSIYEFKLNTETGQVYTSMHTQELKDKVMPCVLEKLGLSENEMVYDIPHINYMGQTAVYDDGDVHFVDFYLTLQGVLPAEYDNIDEDIWDILDDPQCKINISIMYYGDVELASIDIEALDLQGLSISITRVEEQVTNDMERPLDTVEELLYSKNYSNLQPEVSYTRWDKYNFEDFTCLYQGYVYKKRDGEAEERFIEAEKDFTISYDNQVITFNNITGSGFDKYIYTENDALISDLREQCYLAVLDDNESDYRVLYWKNYNGKYSLVKNDNSKVETLGKWNSQINEIYMGKAAKKILEEK